MICLNLISSGSSLDVHVIKNQIRNGFLKKLKRKSNFPMRKKKKNHTTLALMHGVCVAF